MKNDYMDLVNESMEQLDKYEDPLELLGKDISYDDFMSWLEIADEEEDSALKSLEGVLESLIKFGHRHHAQIVRIKIKSMK